MRRFFKFMISGLLVAGVASAAFAASVSKSTMTATVTFTGAGLVNMSYQLKSRATPSATPTTITWNSATVGSGWRFADTYIVLSSTITELNGAIYLYTNNRHANANPRYDNPPVQSTSCAGLVCVQDVSRSLSMCWRANGDAIPDSDLTIVETAEHNLIRRVGEDFRCNLWMLDADHYDFASARSLDYVTIKDSKHGIHFAAGPEDYSSGWSLTGDPTDYIYLAANFNNAVTSTTGVTYRTNMLILEAFIE